jgi:transporter family-2 protein
VAGANGALFVTVASYAAPRVGVALLTVALVCGQATGSLGVDRIGLTPAGKHPFTRFRVLGVTLTIVAVLIGAVGSTGNLRVGLLALAVLAGAGVAFQQAALAHVARATGEPMAAGAVNFLAGGLVLIVLSIVLTGGTPPGGWSAPPIDWTGGVLGASIVVVLAKSVGELGVLRAMLTLVAGQSAGGLLLDILVPPAGRAATVLTAVSVALTVLAVFVSGVGRRRNQAIMPANDSRSAGLPDGRSKSAGAEVPPAPAVVSPRTKAS